MQPASFVFDLIGIGIGPFNLGLAALSFKMKETESIFLDKNNSFNWHPGMLLEWTSLQVPFYADLVTLADPCSAYSYLNFLKAKNRLFKFAIREENYVLRIEYNQYCQWVADQLPNLQFNSCVNSIRYNDAEDCFLINCTNTRKKKKNIIRAKKIVIGIGTRPYWPSGSSVYKCKSIFHSSEYMLHRQAVEKSKSIIIIGSGQSAAEIFYDLLQNWHTGHKKLTWYTRSERFYPMDVSPFSCEYSTPDYVHHFYRLGADNKCNTLTRQSNLYRGINQSLLKQIYDALYLKMVKNSQATIKMQSGSSFKKLQQIHKHCFELSLCKNEDDMFTDTADTIIFATGYEYYVPAFMEPVKDLINFRDGFYDVASNYSIDKKGNSIFVQNAEIHTHGFNAPDLSLGPYRNGIILNSILGYEHFKFGDNNVFQQFN